MKDASAGRPDRLRLDRWLWHARVVRTRASAQRLASDGHVRVNGQRTPQPSRPVRVGDVLTIALEHTVLVLEVKALAERRGSADEARQLFEDIGSQNPVAPGRVPIHPR